MKDKVNFLGAIAWCVQYKLSFSEECRYMETALQQYVFTPETKQSNDRKESIKIRKNIGELPKCNKIYLCEKNVNKRKVSCCDNNFSFSEKYQSE